MNAPARAAGGCHGVPPPVQPLCSTAARPRRNYRAQQQRQNGRPGGFPPVTIKKSDRAYYSPFYDEIVLPKQSQYAEDKYSHFVNTAMHEIIHSSGAKNRLNRLSENFTEDEAYSKEELVAQMGSSLLCYLLGYENTDTTNNDINYIRGWLSHLKDNVRELVSAGALAQKAVDYVMNTVYQTT